MVVLAEARTQFRVVAALMIRETYSRFGRENLGFAWLVAEPLCFALPVLGMWSLLRSGDEHGVPVLAMMWTGYLPILLFRHIGQRALAFVRQNAGLLYHRQVTIFDLFAARTVLEIVSNIVAMSVSGLVLISLGAIDAPKDWPLFYKGYFFMAWFSVSIGLIVGGLSERSEIVEKIWMPISYMYMPISGFFYLAGWLPDYIRGWALTLIPPLHAYEMIRGGLFGPAVHTYGDPVYLSYLCAVLTVIGLLFIRDTREWVIIE